METLIQQFASNLDPQVSLLLIKFLINNAKEKGVYERAAQNIEKNTKLNEEIDEETLKKIEEKATNILELVKDVKKLNQLKEKDALNYSYIQKTYPAVNEKELNALLEYAKLNYDHGKYTQALNALRVYHQVNHKDFAEMSYKYQWGLLSCYILQLHSEKTTNTSQLFDEALSLLNAMRNSIDRNTYDAARVSAQTYAEDTDEDEEDEEVEEEKKKEEKSKEELNLEKSKAESLHLYKQLRDKLWLLHMTFFVLFAPNANTSKKQVVYDFFRDEYSKSNTNLSEKVMAIIETEAPYLLRYLFALYIANRRKKHSYQDTFMTDLLKYVQNHTVFPSIEEQYETFYKNDTIMAFVKALYIDVDFDRAIKLREDVLKDVKNDYLLAPYSSVFAENMLSLVLENYLRVHHVVRIPAIAQQINMGQIETEKLLVKIIRNAKLSGKINNDQEIIMGDHMPNFYNFMVKKTEPLKDGAMQIKSLIDNYEANDARYVKSYRSKR